MPSIQSKLFNIFLRLINKKKFLNKQLAGKKFYQFDRSTPTPIIFRKCTIRTYQIDGRNVFSLHPKNKTSCNKHILYLHGGAYVQGFNKYHWQFIAWLVNASGCVVTAPDYPLAPEHTHKVSFEMVTTLYKRLISTLNPDDLILMGDSSGGGFALALAQKLRDDLSVPPSQIVLLSPWLDITLRNPEISKIADKDPFLEAKSLRKAGNLYAGDVAADHHLLSPIYGSLQALGRISLFIGSNEILIADARKLKSMAEENGIEMEYHEYAGMVHAWMFLNLPESKQAREQIVEIIRRG